MTEPLYDIENLMVDFHAGIDLTASTTKIGKVAGARICPICDGNACEEDCGHSGRLGGRPKDPRWPLQPQGLREVQGHRRTYSHLTFPNHFSKVLP